MGRCFVAAGAIVDFVGINNCVKPECRACDVDSKKKTGQKCPDCPFAHNSIIVSTNKERRTRICVKSEFKTFGLTDFQELGKHKLFFFLDHPEMNFTMPDLPDEDFLGNKRGSYDENGRLIRGSGKHFVWHFHHENGLFYDDNSNNLVLCLNTEHKWWESKTDEKYLI